MRMFLVILLALAAIAYAAFYYWNRSGAASNNEIVYCALDAKLCPDGSYVGRVPPNCEFQTCPKATSTNSNILEGTTLNGNVKL